MQYVLGVASGSLIGFTLGLVGGGGSILAVPLLVYVVGVPSPHLAIGTSAFAVAANAMANLIPHTASGAIKWRFAVIFAAAGVVGALLGSSLGKQFDGQRLLFLFALLMLVVGTLMVRNRHNSGDPEVKCGIRNAPKVMGSGALTGLCSGFFGIGGGFLIVPALMASTGMPVRNAVASSLVAVSAFGLTAAINYGLSGLVDWPLAGALIVGGVIGGLIGAAASAALAIRKGALNTVFATLIFSVAAYMLWKSGSAVSSGA